MEIIDCQIHEPLSWLSSHAAHDDDINVRNELATELALAAMDAVGVDAAIIASVGGAREWAEYAPRRCPGRFASLRSAGPHALDPTTPDIDAQVALLHEDPGVVGIRVSDFGPNAERIGPVIKGAYAPLFLAAERHRVPVCIYLTNHLDLASVLARTYPDLCLVIDHVGLQQPMAINDGAGDTPRFRRLPELLALAQFPNVFVKLSGICAMSTMPFPFIDLWPSLHKMLEGFGPSRLMWGSDIQRVRGRFRGPNMNAWSSNYYVGRHTYSDSVAFLLYTDEVSLHDKKLMFGGTLRKVFGWPQ